MKFIYWNSKKCNNFSIILEILIHENPDVLFLAEIDETILPSNLQKLEDNNYIHFENPGCKRITIIKKKNLILSLGIQSPYYSALKDPNKNVTIISVHLPSQMYQHIDGLKSYMRTFRSEIDSEIGNSLNENILIIGDFNVNPFEKPMIDFDGFAASNSKRLRKEAVHLKTRRPLYYNPTWMLYNKNYFPGTKYYLRPSGSAFDVLEHHFLDQVLISYCMNQKITFERIDILEKTLNYIFFNDSTNTVDLSDHLPLIYEYKIA